MEKTTTEGSQRLIPGVVAGVIGLLYVLQDDVHPPQDVDGRVRVPGAPRDTGHAKILQDLGHIPYQGRQLAGLDDTVHLGIPKKPTKLDELHRLVLIIPGIEPPCLSLLQRLRGQFQVPLLFVELLLPLPQHLVEVEDLVTMVGVGLYLVKVLPLSSLSLGLLRVKHGADLGEGFLGDPSFLFPRGEGFLHPCKLLLLREEQLLHLLNYHRHRHYSSRVRRRRK
jgi:hypothetical protein